ncbi:MAG: hypothetical protein WCY30_02270 [Candidatus Neomarinimicrobiota bacterium]|jgi:hypothetical protein
MKRFRGSRIKQIERVLDKSMVTICFEASAFDSIDDYVRGIVKKHSLAPRLIIPFKRSIKRIFIETYGYEYYRLHMTMGGKYLKTAGKFLGVDQFQVISHLINQDIDIWMFCKAVFPKNVRKAYSWFYNNIKRFSGRGCAGRC